MEAGLGPWSPVGELAQAVRQGKISASALVELALERAIEVQKKLNCFSEIDADGDRSNAAAIDRRRALGEGLRSVTPQRCASNALISSTVRVSRAWCAVCHR